MGLLLLLGVGFTVLQDSTYSDGPEVRSDFLPLGKVKALDVKSEEVPKHLEGFLKRSEWNLLIIFRPADCYSCIQYGANIPEEIQANQRDNLQVAGLGVDTNDEELRTFLSSSTDLPYPVYVAPHNAEAEEFYQSLEEIGNTPILALAEGRKVRYATRLTMDEEVMDDRYVSIQDYVSEDVR